LERVHLVRDGLTGCSKGFAFIDYESVEDANAAKEAMNDQKFNGKQIRVDFSINKNNSEVSNCLGIFRLSYSTTEQELKEEFSKFGPLEKVVLVLDTLTRCSRQYAFVYYESVEDAKTARETMNEQEFNGRHIRVNFSLTKMSQTHTPGVYGGKPTAVQLPSD
jgi:RNA recognition motif-containing protein